MPTTSEDMAVIRKYAPAVQRGRAEQYYAWFCDMSKSYELRKQFADNIANIRKESTNH